jgi:hypothetical protein
VQALVTLFDLSGQAVHQNAQSMGWMGYRLGLQEQRAESQASGRAQLSAPCAQSLPWPVSGSPSKQQLVPPPTATTLEAAASEDKGPFSRTSATWGVSAAALHPPAADPLRPSCLELLFKLEPEKLRQCWEAVAEGRTWRAIVRVPASLIEGRGDDSASEMEDSEDDESAYEEDEAYDNSYDPVPPYGTMYEAGGLVATGGGLGATEQGGSGLHCVGEGEELGSSVEDIQLQLPLAHERSVEDIQLQLQLPHERGVEAEQPRAAPRRGSVSLSGGCLPRGAGGSASVSSSGEDGGAAWALHECDTSGVRGGAGFGGLGRSLRGRHCSAWGEVGCCSEVWCFLLRHQMLSRPGCAGRREQAAAGGRVWAAASAARVCGGVSPAAALPLPTGPQ